jgi:Fe-S cluster assembly iron-binding protein IscA
VSVEITEQAAQVLRRSLELGRVDPKSGGIRLRGARGLGGGMDVQVELAPAPERDDELVEVEGLRLFIDPAVSQTWPQAIVDVQEPHQTIVVRSAGR